MNVPTLRRARSIVAASTIAAAVLAGCGTHAQPAQPAGAQAPAGVSTSQPGSPANGAAGGSAVSALARLPIKGRAPMTGYSRAQFGPAWADVDHNGCDTRNDILRRDLTQVVFRSGTHNCIVLSGTYLEPYSGKVITFHRGAGSSAVQIDHVVALGDAWQSGAQSWTPDKRLHYANDPLVLLAVDGPLNQQKGDANAASWLPPNKSYRCPYVARQVAIKLTYGLWVTAPEHDAIARVLATCPTQQMPTGTSAVPVATSPGQTAPTTTDTLAPPAAATAGSTANTATPASTGGLDPRFPSCKAAKAAGYGPYVKGRDVEYGWYDDANHDGRVCT